MVRRAQCHVMPRHGQRSFAPGAACLRLVTHNVHKQLATHHVELRPFWAEVLRGDVVALQETACSWHAMQAAMLHTSGAYRWHLPNRASLDAPRSAGVALLVRASLLDGGSVTAGAVWSGPRGAAFDHRVVGVPLNWAGHSLFVVSVYLPNHDQAAWLDGLMPHLLEACGCRQLVLLGDFNFVEDPRLDRVRSARAAQLPGDAAGTASLRAFCPAGALVDAYRDRSPAGGEMTFLHAAGAARLDRVYVAAGLQGFLASCRAGPWHFSDHRAVVAVLAAQQPSGGAAARGPGVPRCRLSFVHRPDLLQQFRDWCHAQAAFAPADDEALLLWWPSYFKPALVREVRRLNRASRMVAAHHVPQPQGLPSLSDWQAAVAAAQARMDAGDAAALPALLSSRRALRAALRSGPSPPAWLHVREGPCPALSAAVAPRQVATAVAALRGPSGFLHPPGPAQAQLMVRHLAAVSGPFTPDAAAVDAVLAAVARPARPRLSAAEAAALDAPVLGEGELQRALRRLPSGASPGLDAIPLEAYRKAASSLLPLLTRVFNYVLAQEAVPSGFLDGAVVSLPKPGAADPTNPASYRPITLLNTDYKLLAKLLANRLLCCVGTVVAPTQTGYVPGRHIGANVLTLQLLPHHLAAAGQSGVVVFLDTRKAFDTVDRRFLLAVMAAVGVGPRFRAWVSLLLGDTRACSVLNGHVSERARFRAGVRQGCPLSPLLYLFVGEALLRFLSRHDLFGLPLPGGGGTLVALQFADDTQVPLAGPHLEADLNEFGRASNQRVNVDKTTALPVGLSAPLPANPPPTPGGMRLSASADALGFTFSQGVGAVVPKRGWDVLQRTALMCIDRLGGQPLSIFGRALAASAYSGSGLLYAAEFSAVPPAVLSSCQAAMAAFVQSGLTPATRDRRRFKGVRSELLVSHPSQGGFGLLPLREHVLARRATWACRLLACQGGHPWLQLARSMLQAAAPWLLGAWPGDAHLPDALLAALPPVLCRLLEAATSLPRALLIPLPPRAGQPQPGVVAGWRLPLSSRVVPAHALDVKAATEILLARGGAELRRQEELLTFILANGPPGVATPEGARRGALLSALCSTLRALWRLPWTNDFKQVYWLLLYGALPTVARLHLPGACPCGLPSYAQVAGLPATPPPPNDWQHVFWECHVAQAVRAELQRCCGNGAVLTRRHILLMQPPPGVVLDVWLVVCLAAVNAVWRCRAQPTSAAVPVGTVILRAGAAVECFWSLLHDFVRAGRYRQRWRRAVSATHPFLRFERASAPLTVHRPPFG